MYKLTLRLDDQLRSYLQSIFRSSDLERNEIIQAMMYFGSHSMEFKQFLSNYVSQSPSLPFDGGLGTWILPKKTLNRIEGEECRHAVKCLFGGTGNTGLERNESRTIDQGTRILPKQINSSGTVSARINDGKNDHGQERETSRFTREVRQSDIGSRGTTRISHINGKTGGIKINF